MRPLTAYDQALRARVLGRLLEVPLIIYSAVAGLIVVLREHPWLNLAKDDPRVQAMYVWPNVVFEEGATSEPES